MLVEVDQSGKLEHLDTATVVAYSNKKHGAVWISAGVKRKLVLRLRKRFQRKKDLWPVMFAWVVFLCVQNLSSEAVLKIDEEYSGKEQVIAGTLEWLFKRKYANKWRGRISFGRIGKSSPAHQLAWRVHRTKNRQGVRRLSDEDILQLLR